jgi:hypothetical protein
MPNDEDSRYVAVLAVADCFSVGQRRAEAGDMSRLSPLTDRCAEK